MFVAGHNNVVETVRYVVAGHNNVMLETISKDMLLLDTIM